MTEPILFKKVVMIQRVACDYRQPFFEQVHQRLAEKSIDFQLVAGRPWDHEGFIDILSDLPFGVRAKNCKLFRNVYWERGALPAARDADLVIFEQANAGLHLYPLLLRWGSRRRKIAFNGHGAHLNKTAPHPLRDAWRNYWINKVDWWFPYTALSADIVEKSGFPADRISVVQNAIDTKKLVEDRSKLSLEGQDELFFNLFGRCRQESDRVGVFCARLVELKWIPFLLESLEILHRELPDFKMIIVGDGPERNAVDTFCFENKWCVCVGAKHGEDRVPYLALGDVFLNPGASGLAVLDAFALGMPFFTTNNGIHGPEIEYLKRGENGDISQPTVSCFAKMASALLCDEKRLGQMKEAARKSGRKYTIENMSKNFAEGVVKALDNQAIKHRSCR